jgi:hypothetical protein
MLMQGNWLYIQDNMKIRLINIAVSKKNLMAIRCCKEGQGQNGIGLRV